MVKGAYKLSYARLVSQYQEIVKGHGTGIFFGGDKANLDRHPLIADLAPMREPEYGCGPRFDSHWTPLLSYAQGAGVARTTLPRPNII
jgi:hypothetical protein